ncbi:MAG: MgtC/SapB family protein [Planctomycetales bacterium]|nr:MgtC/SapB family protein [bacterium]UNM07697.1 MAG: MgtC/SapB family protein [Planctomycetales bacterium]
MQALGEYLPQIGQLVLAVVLGFLVGLEREVHDKPAGITTMGLVTLAGTLLCQLSLAVQQFGGGGDPTRIAAAVMTGIGFLGAGSILREGRHVEGVTTAATIWVMSAVGIAIGASYYVPAIATVLLVLFGFWLKPYTDRLADYIRKRRGLPPRG